MNETRNENETSGPRMKSETEAGRNDKIFSHRVDGDTKWQGTSSKEEQNGKKERLKKKKKKKKWKVRWWMEERHGRRTFAGSARPCDEAGGLPTDFPPPPPHSPLDFLSLQINIK